MLESYNKDLERFKKAEEFFNDETISDEVKEKHIGNLKELIASLEKKLAAIKKHRNVSEEEILNGFK